MRTRLLLAVGLHAGLVSITGAVADPIQMERVAVIPTPAVMIVAGADADHDDRGEFVFKDYADPFGNTPLRVYESAADNVFALVHVLDLEKDDQDTFGPVDGGDPDQDGLAELIVAGQVHVPGVGLQYSIRSYESLSPRAFPTELVWQTAPANVALNARLGDLDDDGKQEVVVDHASMLKFYESAGNNTYVLTQSLLAPASSHRVANDLDGDGRAEIIAGTFSEGIMYRVAESTGDDACEVVWTWDPEPEFSVQFIVDAGDLDHDGRREFLTGGLKPTSGAGDPLQCLLHVFEAVGDDDYELVATIVRPGSVEGYCTADVGDVDGDGDDEIVFGNANTVTIQENVGDNLWEQIWLGVGTLIQSIGVADHDRDGKAEIVFRGGNNTGVWEIDPVYQADLDGDNRVDAIDNCLEVPNPGQEDADGDAVGDACDNCIHGPNPGQGPAPLGQTILAADAETFSWPLAADVLYVRGDLAGVGGYGFDLLDSLPMATSLADTTVPAGGSGFWYLLRPDCPVGSWQSTVGAEPGRDAVLP